MEITFQTFQNRFLLRPGRDLRKTFIGVLAQSLELYPVRLHAITTMSNHVHVLISPHDVQQMSRFVQHLKTNVSKEVGRLRGWSGGIFGARFHSIPVSDEPAAQIARLRYLLSQGCKEGLVASPFDWPGVQSATALSTGRPLDGERLDREAFRAARRRDPQARRSDFVERCEVRLDPLPCWESRPDAEWRGEVQDLITQIEADTANMHRRADTRPVGARRACRKHPGTRTEPSERTPAPKAHAFLRRARRELEEALRRFVEDYRSASERFRGGARHTVFPRNCWLPSIPSTGSKPRTSVPI